MSGSAPCPPANAGRRDPRIDIIRGAALLFIYIDHIRGNRVAAFTVPRFAFFDCADLFVFLSGYVSGLVYTRSLLQQGLMSCWHKAARRCRQILFAHILVSSFVILVLHLFLLHGVRLPGRHLYTFVDYPGWAVLNMLSLWHLPDICLSILPMYIFFVGLSPLMAWAFTKRRILSLVPVVIYLLAQRVPGFNLHWYPGLVSWGFNPLAWQLIFASGFLIGNVYVNGSEFVRVRRWHGLLLAAGLVGIAIIRVGTSSVLASILHTHLLLERIPAEILFTGKLNAEPLRILNLLMAAMAVCSIAKSNRLWTFRGFNPLLVCGRNSLVVFSVGAVLSVCASCLRFQAGHHRAVDVALSVAGCALLVLAGEITRRIKEVWRAGGRQSDRAIRVASRCHPADLSEILVPLTPRLGGQASHDRNDSSGEWVG